MLLFTFEDYKTIQSKQKSMQNGLNATLWTAYRKHPFLVLNPVGPPCTGWQKYSGTHILLTSKWELRAVYKVSTCLALQRKSQLEVNKMCVPEYFCHPVEFRYSAFTLHIWWVTLQVNLRQWNGDWENCSMFIPQKRVDSWATTLKIIENWHGLSMSSPES